MILLLCLLAFVLGALTTIAALSFVVLANGAAHPPKDR